MQQLLLWIAFFFLTFVAKLLLGVVMCYMIFPVERTCDSCDADTLPVRMGWAGRAMSWLMRGTLQKRWCPRCGWEGMTRTGGMAGAHPPVPGTHPAAP